jgi:hypothetical protein|tara:strand:- start:183 stop:422 length:240 start_codon:yes stop_codon:yes gene_type:complete
LAWVGRSQHDDVFVFAGASKPIDSARQGELRRSEAGDEVAAPHLALFFERLQDRIDASEPAFVALAECGLAGEDAVTLE